MSVNKAILIGRLGADPEVRYTQAGDAVANFNIATSESYTDKSGQKVEKTEWHRIVVWKRLAEICGEYLKKGREVYVEGKIETRKWQDKDGVEKYTTEIKAQTVQFLGSASDGQSAGQGQGGNGGGNGGGGYRPPAGTGQSAGQGGGNAPQSRGW